MLGSSIAGAAASDEYGDADDGLVADELTPLDDVVLAEEAGEMDELIRVVRWAELIANGGGE